MGRRNQQPQVSSKPTGFSEEQASAFVEHIRLVHFSILTVCVAMVTLRLALQVDKRLQKELEVLTATVAGISRALGDHNELNKLLPLTPPTWARNAPKDMQRQLQMVRAEYRWTDKSGPKEVAKVSVVDLNLVAAVVSDATGKFSLTYNGSEYVVTHAAYGMLPVSSPRAFSWSEAYARRRPQNDMIAERSVVHNLGEVRALWDALLDFKRTTIAVELIFPPGPTAEMVQKESELTSAYGPSGGAVAGVLNSYMILPGGLQDQYRVPDGAEFVGAVRPHFFARGSTGRLPLAARAVQRGIPSTGQDLPMFEVFHATVPLTKGGMAGVEAELPCVTSDYKANWEYLVGSAFLAGGTFAESFPTIVQECKHLMRLDLPELQAELLSRVERERTVSLLGAVEIPSEAFGWLGGCVVAAMQLYLALHLAQLRRVSKGLMPMGFAWIGLYRGLFARWATLLTVVVFPLIVEGLVVWDDIHDAIAWAAFGLGLPCAVATTVMLVRQARA